MGYKKENPSDLGHLNRCTRHCYSSSTASGTMLLLVFTFGKEQGLYQEQILEGTILATREDYPKRTMRPIRVVGVLRPIEKKNRPLIFVVGVYVSSVLFLAKKKIHELCELTLSASAKIIGAAAAAMVMNCFLLSKAIRRVDMYYRYSFAIFD
jgi:hypothetical protein